MLVVSDNPRAQAIQQSLGDFVPPEGVCLVLGGDGTMLRAIRETGGRMVYFGAHCGHLGFLMNDLPDAPEVAAQALRVALNGGFDVQTFPRLHASLTTGSGMVRALGVNDVYVERASGQTCHLRVLVDEVEVVARLVCDGMIAATPLGSTAYSFSAGGAAAHPLLRGIQLTPICPHAPRLAPLVLPEHARVRIEVLDADRRPARAAVDGAHHGDVTVAEISDAGEPVRLAFLSGHNFTVTLIRKVLRA